jgi:hypothetical protein
MRDRQPLTVSKARTRNILAILVSSFFVAASLALALRGLL